MALEYIHEDRYEEPDCANNTDDEDFLPERWRTEDPAVQQQQRDLYHGNRKAVGHDSAHHQLRVLVF